MDGILYFYGSYHPCENKVIVLLLMVFAWRMSIVWLKVILKDLIHFFDWFKRYVITNVLVVLVRFEVFWVCFWLSRIQFQRNKIFENSIIWPIFCSSQKKSFFFIQVQSIYERVISEWLNKQIEHGRVLFKGLRSKVLLNSEFWVWKKS